MSLLSGIFREDSLEYAYPMSRSNFLQILMVAALGGLVTWLLGVAFDRFMLTPVFCAAAPDIAICSDSTSLASHIAMVLVGVMLIPIIIMLGIKRPLVVVVAAVAVLWGVMVWSAGPWWVSLLWSVAASIVVYLAICWINRIRGNAAAILFITLFVIIARFVLLA